MNFRRAKHREEPEINFIPLIDLLLVILIFLMVTTTYSRFAELQINLPSTEEAASVSDPKDKMLNVAIDAQGRFNINNQPLNQTDLAGIKAALQQAAGDNKDPVVVINADNDAKHQNVVLVMEAAQSVGFAKVTFAIDEQTPGK
ncbi:ExbD/TolR family protein [Leeia sp.]|uniref:ExbD/TolR family protein n=1 Tax=Leeia sp. TaxID=2884678 RepID=UPI0035AF4F52